MGQVIHLVWFNYGLGTGTTTIRCNAEDDMSVIEGKVKRDKDLNYLPMCSFSVKILSTTPVPSYDDGDDF